MDLVVQVFNLHVQTESLHYNLVFILIVKSARMSITWLSGVGVSGSNRK